MTVAESPRISFINVDGQRLRVATQAGDPRLTPLVVFNGLGASLEMLDPFIDALGPGIGTIRIDVPGVGGSPAPLCPYRFADLARLVARALDQLEYGSVDVLGISWGGALAQQFAFQYRGRTRRLVLVSTSMGGFMVPGRLSSLLMLTSRRRYLDPAYMTAIAGHLYGGRMKDRPDLAANYAREVRSGGVRGYYLQLLAAAGWTSVHWLWRLRQPTLILSGRQDPIVPWINGRIMASLMRNARLHAYDDGHLGLLTSADDLAPIVRQFLLED
jgi:poly(3-hydroxyalkanoate) depolymerase